MKVSLLLTTYNCAGNLRRTLHSISEQDYPDIEIVIKDGASNDGTLNVICDYAKQHTNVIWSSNPDGGIYDALNQAYRMSSGDVVAVCNDMFTVKNAVSKFVNAISAGGKDCMGAHSDLIYATDERVVRYWHMGQGTIRQGWMPGHPTLYLKREVYEQYGLYDTSYKCSGDFEFMVRILNGEHVKLAYIPEVLIRMFYGGTSTGGQGYLLSVRESYRALVSNGCRPAGWIILLRTLKTMRQFLNKYQSAEENIYEENNRN